MRAVCPRRCLRHRRRRTAPLLAPSHHHARARRCKRHLETALAPATLNKRSASVTDQIELEEWWSLTPERLRRIFKEVDVDDDGFLRLFSRLAATL